MKSETPARNRQTRHSFLPQHEIGSLLQIPSALRFIEDHDVFDWRTDHQSARHRESGERFG